MSADEQLTDEQFAELSARFARRTRGSSVFRELGEEPALWLALPPSWTTGTAELARFPAPVLPFVRDAAQASLIEVNDSGAGDVTFWLRDRDTLLNRCLDHFGPAHVQEVAATIAGRVLDAEHDGHDIGAAVHDWASLVLTGHGHIPGDALLSRVRDAVAAGDLARAMTALATAEALGPLAPHLASAVVRARRLVHVGYRRRHDIRALDAFLTRDEQITAIRDLVAGDPQSWALHLIGMGGVGKTMLIRYLSCGLFARDQRMPVFPVARVDFDHLSPAYPMRRPVQLLVELADELAPFADDARRGRLLEGFLEMAVSVHAASSAPGVDTGPLVQLAITQFGQFLSALPQPVLLVLDTCEELAKLHPGDAEAPALARTFDLLERVHAAAPGVRVLFAGRRHLASRGAGWSLPAPGPLPPRDYLSRLELRGFTRTEAVAYLDADRMPAELVEEILARSPEAGRTAGLVAPGETRAAGDRYNPFDLALYRSWWQSEPDLTGERLRTAGEDAYVEARIVARLQDPALVRLLPAVALLGTADETLLGPVTDGSGVTPAAAVARLGDQEWVETATDPDTGAPILRVAELLRPRLLRWAARPQRQARFAATRELLAGHLARHVTEQPLDRVGADHVITALRLREPDRAASLWAEIEDRVAAGRRWDWAAAVLPRVLGDLVDEPGRPLLIAALTATSIGVQRRQNPFGDLEPLWAAVAERVAGAHRPGDPGAADWDIWTAAWLLRRAMLGAAATRRRPSTPAERDQIATLVGEPSTLIDADAAIAAALETMAEQNSPADLAGLRVAAVRWFSGRDLAPDAAAAAGVALAAMTASDAREAESFLLAAEETVRHGDGGRAAADLPGRPDPLTWIRLHRARLGLRDTAVAGLPRNEDRHEDRLDTVDGERLASQRLLTELASGVVPAARLDAIAAANDYSVQRRPDRLIHDAVPPLFVTVARGYVAAGRPERAREILEGHRRAARSGRAEDSTERHANLALAWLSRRMRWALPPGLLGSGIDARLWAAQLLTGGGAAPWTPAAADDPEVWLAWWSARLRDPSTDRIRLPEITWTRGDPTVPGLRLAAEQAVRIGDGPGRGQLRAWLSGESGEAAFRLVDEDPFAWVRSEPPRSDVFRAARLTAPPVAVAEAALETGELLALREPESAGELLDVAERAAAGRSPVIALQAAVCATLAAPENGHRLPERYAEFRAHIGDEGVPAWTDLPAATGYAGPWRDWLDRVRLAAALADGRPLPEPSAEGAPETDPARYRSAAARPGTDRAVARPADSRPGPAPPPAPGGRPAVVRAALLLSAVLTVLAVAGMALLIRSATDLTVLQTALVVLSAFLSALAGVGGSRIIPAVRRRIVWSLGDSDARCRVTSAEAGAEPGAEAGAEAGAKAGAEAVVELRARRAHLLSRRLLLRRQDRWDTVMRGPVEDGVPRLRIASGPGFTSGARRGRLHVGEDHAAIDWEAAVAAATGSADAWQLTWARASTGSGLPQHVATSWETGGIDIIAPPGCAGPVRDGYGSSLPSPVTRENGAVEVVDGGATNRIRHRVGAPLLTANGVLLRLDPRTRRDRPDGGVVIAPEDVPPGRCPLVVLQDVPHDGPLYHDDIENGLLRHFAVRAAASGANAVLVLPALPFELVTPVITCIGERIARRPERPGATTLARTTAEIKTTIIRYGERTGQLETARRIALHVLHFRVF
ncbi:ATP-binding protein [Actinoplanes missouriensis]|uniref:ATP-binding protein n=1 Tax=Actinoplanes missouriensis TaxID=1866 RepID=UPI0033E3AD08